MRSVLEPVQRQLPAEHLGLAYDMWAPTAPGTGKVPDKARRLWLNGVSQVRVPEGYRESYARWKGTLVKHGASALEITLASRMLIGHGNASPTEVGLTLHHAWGVPVIPGSSLKGLAANYVDACYGPAEELTTNPRLVTEADGADRARFAGVSWDRRRIAHGPGEAYAQLFGAPAAEDDLDVGLGAGERQGLIAFHDAWLVPPDGDGARLPVAADVITVHQKSYYDSKGTTFPNDYDDPNPVSFLSVKPGARFLVALDGPAGWVEMARMLLIEALAHWGVGAKTSSGYGRIVPPTPTAGPGEPATNIGQQAVMVSRIEECRLQYEPGPRRLVVGAGASRALATGPDAQRLMQGLGEPELRKAIAGRLKLEWVEVRQEGNQRTITALGPVLTQ